MNGETTNSALSEQPASANASVDRRKHPRYRFAAPISVRTSEGTVLEAITLEISESGLSAVLSSPLKVGDTARLEPVGGGAVTAEVRHHTGKVYGFKFLQVTDEQIKRLQDDCRRLPRYPPNKMGI
jgi:hypothetical protein